MSFQEVLYEIEGHVATVTLNRPGQAQCVDAADVAGSPRGDAAGGR